MPTVPLHGARAALSALIAACASAPVRLTRNGQPVAVLVHPDSLATGASLDPSVWSALRADLLHALAVLGED